MRKLLIQPQARVDLLEIWHYIARDSIESANCVTERIDAEIRDLLPMPGKGHTRPEVRDTRYRFWVVHSYIIAYRYNGGTLTVVRIVHGARDFRRLFRNKP